MIANITKNNSGKLLVALMAMFIIVAGASIVISDNSNAAIDNDDVASIGENGYNTLSDAIDTAQTSIENGTTAVTINLLKNVSEVIGNESSPEDLSSITINCGTYSLQLNNSYISNGTIIGTGTGAYSSGDWVLGFSGTCEATGTTVTMNSATLEEGETTGSIPYAAILVFSGATVTLETSM